MSALTYFGSDTKTAVYRGHKLETIASASLTGRTWARIMGGKHLPHVVSTLGQARLRTRVDGNVWGLSVSDLPKEFSTDS